MSACIEYPGGRTGNGYGSQWDPEAQCVDYAHRLAWRKARGPIPEGMEIMHDCDNPPCVNIDHLRLGTHAENMADMARKGRGGGRRASYNGDHWTQREPERVPRGDDHWSRRPGAVPLGALNPSAKLTQAQVDEIRARYTMGGVLQRELAAECGVDQTTISHVVRRMTYAA